MVSVVLYQIRGCCFCLQGDYMLWRTVLYQLSLRSSAVTSFFQYFTYFWFDLDYSLSSFLMGLGVTDIYLFRWKWNLYCYSFFVVVWNDFWEAKETKISSHLKITQENILNKRVWLKVRWLRIKVGLLVRKLRHCLCAMHVTAYLWDISIEVKG